MIRLTHIGGPTTLVEAAGWRLLTDPTFDPPGRRYGFGWGTSSRKLSGPAVSADAIGHLDAVLLSHDQHADNLDDAGRALLPSAGVVVTTVPGARRVGGIGLAPWDATVLRASGRPDLTVTATPCRHGPSGFRRIVGDVVGFVLECDGARVWVTGDTVLFDGVRQAAARLRPDVLLLHLGGVRFPVTGPLRFTLTAREGRELCDLARPRVVVAVHHEGWSHFHEGRAEVDRAFAGSGHDVRLPRPGEAVAVAR